MFGWDPFQYQITKYVMRWKDKHATHAQRVEDLRKARHFLDKYIEEAAAFDPRYGADAGEYSGTYLNGDAVPNPRAAEKDLSTTEALNALAEGHFTCEGYFGDGTQHYKCNHCGAFVRAKTLVDAYRQHSACATAVSQLTHP